MTKLNPLQETVLAMKLERQAKAKQTIPVSETRKNLAVTKSYTSLDITNAVEQVLVAHGYCDKDSYECNSFLMDTLETLGHYKGGK